MKITLSKTVEEKTFRELWRLFDEIGAYAKRYPMLYAIYLLLATPERVQKQHNEDEKLEAEREALKQSTKRE